MLLDKARVTQLLLLLLLLSPLLGVPAHADEPCPRLAPTHSPNWPMRGAFVSPTSLLMIDPSNRQMVEFDVAGGGQHDLSGNLQQALSFLKPIAVKPSASGFTLMLDQGPRVAFLDERLRPTPTTDLEARSGLFKFAYMDYEIFGNQVVACADFKVSSDDEAWQTGFLRFPLAGPGELEILHSFDPNPSGGDADEQGAFYCQSALGPYAASVGGEQYVLLMLEKPGIFRIPKQVPQSPGLADAEDRLERLDAFPKGLERRPELPQLWYRGNYEQLMSELTFSSLPVGLYPSPSGNDLMVLSREPAGGGVSLWTLTRIDPRTDRVVGAAQIPIRGTHAYAVPGPAYWAFIEQPASGRYLNHPLDSILFIPTRQIRGIGGERAPYTLCR